MNLVRHSPLIIAAVALAGCATDNADHSAAASTPPAQLNIVQQRLGPSTLPANLGTRGPEAARQLKAWYDATPSDCGGADKPSHMCSGIMLRGTASRPDYPSWDPSESAIELGGVSFSWLRRDHTFDSIWENRNGLIFYPHQQIPAGKLRNVQVLCSFPSNADSWRRPTQQGCGPIEHDSPLTDPCETQGIVSADAWLDKYTDLVTTNRICGWNQRPGSGAVADWFATSVDAHQRLPTVRWRIFDELLLSAWQRGQGAILPIQSFFYPADQLESRAKAQRDQTTYYAQYGQLLPLIRLALPKSKDHPAVISYLEGDQAVGPGVPNYHVGFEDLPTGPLIDLVSAGLGFNVRHSTLKEIRDKPDSDHFTGRYLAVNLQAEFPVDVAANARQPRRVTLSWGCNTYCMVRQANSGEVIELVSDDGIGPMRHGRLTLQVQAPEVIQLNTTGEDGSLLLLDNLDID
ncbi:hypothetical protein [Pseudomonas maumuensis]|uniref:Uncharacterized protein n=1 Tax=Pseudomonas maumuensis TaxID=2842354 RepID=A0ABX8NF92_9PSED|nr:hypothetical protein [Pseudomonas maumuensis]QXH54565.1 hypothetical protein KSS90_14440 [Pseudomonas maumuensis]